jgi:L-iditol 2-dehydrogenase
MKAIAAVGEGKVEVVDVPLPPIREYECRVRVRASALCNGTDLKIIDNQLTDWEVEYPCILGHENAGEVVEVGPKVKYIKVGDRYVDPMGRLAPGTPYGRMWAAMAEFAVVQDHRAMDELGVDPKEYAGRHSRPVPSSIGFEDATILLTLKECLSGVRNFGVREGTSILLYGDGPVGLALTRFLRLSGASWLAVVGHHGDRLERIRERAGPDLTINSREQSVPDALGDRKLDLVIDAVGSTAIIREGSRLLKEGGKVCVYGVLKRKDRTLSLNELANNTALHMLNWPRGQFEAHDEVVQLVLDGKLELRDYYTHVIPVDGAADGVAKLRSREAFKVVYAF